MYRFVFFFSCLFVLSSCEDFFSTTLEIDPPEHKTQMVMHAVITDVDTLFRVSLGKSVGILDNANRDSFFLKGGAVSLYEGEQKIGDLDEIEVSLVSSFVTDYNFQKGFGTTYVEAGKTYTCKATHPTFGEATSTQTMPTAVPITKSIIRDNNSVNDLGESTTQVEITINDPEGIDNYYELALFTLFENGDELAFDNIYVSTLDPNLREGFGGAHLLNDETFDGKEYKILVDFDQYWEDDQPIYAIWRTVTKDYYLYSKSIRQQQDAEDFGFFAEPVSIHNNVTNGLGIFGMRAELIVELGE